MTASGTALKGKHTVEVSALYMAFELSEKNWKLSLGDGVRAPSRYTVAAGDTAMLLECIAKAKARCELELEASVRSCYEAGRDGFWLHRWLIERGIDNIVVDSASIEVNRRARRAKTDRLDADKLLAMLLRYVGGERRVWSVVRVPTLEEEDARRAHRELERLVRERTAHVNRIRALLVLHNLRVKYVGGRLWQRWWAGHAQELAPGVRAEIERESARLLLVKQQMDAIEAAQRQAVAAGTEPQIAGLAQLRGIGMSSGWVLAKEFFGWRRFRNRRQVAGWDIMVPISFTRRELVASLFKASVAAAVLPSLAAAQSTSPSSTLIEDLVAANRILAQQGILDGYGHVSVRQDAAAGRYLLSRSLAPALATTADIQQYDLDSNALDSAARPSFIERFIHGEIYRARPDVHAIVHSHAPALIPFGVTGVALRPLYHMTAFVGEGVPVFEICKARGDDPKMLMLVHNPALGRALAETLGKKPAALMRGHGAVIVGSSLPQVVGRSVYLALNATLQAQAAALGGSVNYLDPQEAREEIPANYQRAWDLWKRQAMAAECAAPRASAP